MEVCWVVVSDLVSSAGQRDHWVYSRRGLEVSSLQGDCSEMVFDWPGEQQVLAQLVQALHVCKVCQLGRNAAYRTSAYAGSASGLKFLLYAMSSVMIGWSEEETGEEV